jgi:hypothetical protein
MAGRSRKSDRSSRNLVRGQEFYADSARRLRGTLGTLLPAGTHQSLWTVSVLVRSLLIAETLEAA